MSYQTSLDSQQVSEHTSFHLSPPKTQCLLHSKQSCNLHSSRDIQASKFDSLGAGEQQNIFYSFGIVLFARSFHIELEPQPYIQCSRGNIFSLQSQASVS